MQIKIPFIILFALFSISSFAKLNLHVIDTDPETGFAIYRTSKPDSEGMKELCDAGITEIMVMSGNAVDFEQLYSADCPGLKVIFDKQMKAKLPMSESFLNKFDTWVKDAQEKGKKIAFRCNCGCHRTGRLAAYYQMKYQRLSAVDAKIIMKKHGKFMFLFPYLKPQVDALKDYIMGRECSTKEKYCVRAE
jgi:hypothetical protein